MATRWTWTLVSAAAALTLLALAACAFAQGAAPKPAADNEPYANEKVEDVLKGESKGKDAGPSPYLPGLETVLRMLLWLIVLVVFIYVAIWLIRRYVPSARGMFGGGALKVVSRVHLAAKQSIVLVKLGGRFVMVGVTPVSMTPLTEITDPEEAKQLTEELAGPSAGGASGSFKSALGRADAEVAETAGAEPPAGESDVREVRQQLDDVRRKVNWWRGQTKS